jgi:hypothetical protein
VERLLFGGFIALTLLRLSYAEELLCKDDLDCLIKYNDSKDIHYLEYGCDNYKDRSPGNSCIMLYNTLLPKMKEDMVYLCDKGNTAACLNKIEFNLDGKFRNKVSAEKETNAILKKSEQECEYKEDYMGCITASTIYEKLKKPEKAKYYYNKGVRILIKQISTELEREINNK